MIPAVATALGLGLAFSLAATLPVAAVGWALGFATERFVDAPGVRAWVWRGIVGLSVASAAAVPAWRLCAGHAATRFAFEATVQTAFASTASAPSSPHWDRLLAPAALSIDMLVGVGAVIGIILLAMSYARGGRLVHRARPFDVPDVILRLQCKARRLGVSMPPVFISPQTPAAVLVGLRRPAIVLPETLARTLDADALTWIGAHELAHLKRGDNLRVIADRLIASLFWFNPFLTRAVGRLAAVREELCDAAALSDAAAEDRRRYATTLIHALRLSAGPAQQPAFIRRKGQGHLMRLQAILHPTGRPTRAAMAASTALLCAAAVSTLFVSGAFAQALGSASAQASEGSTVKPLAKDTKASKFEVYADLVTTDGKKGVFIGHPSITGTVTENVRVMIDGRSLPPGFHLESVQPDRIDRIETEFDGVQPHFNDHKKGPKLLAVNIVTKP